MGHRADGSVLYLLGGGGLVSLHFAPLLLHSAISALLLLLLLLLLLPCVARISLDAIDYRRVANRSRSQATTLHRA